MINHGVVLPRAGRSPDSVIIEGEKKMRNLLFCSSSFAAGSLLAWIFLDVHWSGPLILFSTATFGSIMAIIYEKEKTK